GAALTVVGAAHLSVRWVSAALAVGAIVLFGRIYVGAHLPLDVVGGFALGAAAAAVVHPPWGGPEGNEDPPPPPPARGGSRGGVGRSGRVGAGALKRAPAAHPLLVTRTSCLATSNECLRSR